MIAISYRREDTTPITGRIYDRILKVFGRERIFMDLDSIPLGVDFRAQIGESLNHCKVLLVVIGPRWFGVSVDGRRRIDDPTDVVRFEVAQALKRGIRVIPLLIDRTEMPDGKTLPEDLADLAFRNALRVDSGADFHHHVDRLCEALRLLPVFATPHEPPPLSNNPTFVAKPPTSNTPPPSEPQAAGFSSPAPLAGDDSRRERTGFRVQEHSQSESVAPVVGLLLGLFGLIAWFIPLFGLPVTVAGLVVSVKGLKSAGRGMALAGLILCIIGLVLTIINASIGAYQGARGEHWLQE